MAILKQWQYLSKDCESVLAIIWKYYSKDWESKSKSLHYANRAGNAKVRTGDVEQ